MRGTALAALMNGAATSAAIVLTLMFVRRRQLRRILDRPVSRHVRRTRTRPRLVHKVHDLDARAHAQRLEDVRDFVTPRYHFKCDK